MLSPGDVITKINDSESYLGDLGFAIETNTGKWLIYPIYDEKAHPLRSGDSLIIVAMSMSYNDVYFCLSDETANWMSITMTSWK